LNYEEIENLNRPITYKKILLLIKSLPRPTKPEKGKQQQKKLQASILDEHRCKNPQQNTSKPNPTAH
jgi:hypothetical protein